jgi:hypothetical protein
MQINQKDVAETRKETATVNLGIKGFVKRGPAAARAMPRTGNAGSK